MNTPVPAPCAPVIPPNFSPHLNARYSRIRNRHRAAAFDSVGDRLAFLLTTIGLRAAGSLNAEESP